MKVSSAVYFEEVVFLKAYILGAGPFARELGAYLSPLYKEVHFVTDDPPPDLPTLSKGDYEKYGKDGVTYLGSGKSEVKLRMLAEMAGAAGEAINLAVYTGQDCLIGNGSIIAPGVVLAPFSKIGEHVLVNYCASIGHDTVIHDCAVVAPNASVGGGCVLEKGCYIGAGANIRENLTVAEGAIVGMGAVVTKNVAMGAVVTGVPAKEGGRSGGW